MNCLFGDLPVRVHDCATLPPYIYSIRCEVWIWRDLAISTTGHRLYRYRRAIGEAVNDAPGCCHACRVLPLSLCGRSFVCSCRTPAFQTARAGSPVLPSHILQGEYRQGAGTQVSGRQTCEFVHSGACKGARALCHLTVRCCVMCVCQTPPSPRQ